MKSQKAVLQETGRTYGILGCGADVCYPAAHRELYEELVKQGGIISEYPPRTRPRAMFFPQRNRLISFLDLNPDNYTPTFLIFQVII